MNKKILITGLLLSCLDLIAMNTQIEQVNNKPAAQTQNDQIQNKSDQAGSANTSFWNSASWAEIKSKAKELKKSNEGVRGVPGGSSKRINTTVN